MIDRMKLWFLAYFWAWVLVVVASLIQRRRMSHNAGITASGKIKVNTDARIPPHEFFAPGREFRCRIRHAPVSYDDDTIIQVRSASLKFADTNCDSPLDLEMNTGKISLFWTANNFKEFVLDRDMVDGLAYRKFYAKYPRGIVAAKDGIRRDPSSFAELYYHSQVAQRFVGKDGVERYVKFRLVPFDRGPESGLVPLEDVENFWREERRPDETRSPNYLKNEYRERLARGPLKFRLELQLHTPSPDDDPELLNCNKEWDPETHPYLEVAVVEIDKALSWEEECRMIYSIKHCPESLALLPASSADDYNSINYLRAKSSISKHARIFAYQALDAWPKPMPDDPAAARVQS